MEGLYKGSNGVELVAVGVLNPSKKAYNDNEDPFIGKIGIPKLLSLLTERDPNAFVPGIGDLIDGGYPSGDGVTISAQEKMARGRLAIQAMADYRKAVKAGDETAMQTSRSTLEENFRYFGYGYIKDPAELIPPVALTFYSFRVMVGLGLFFMLIFVLVLVLGRKEQITKHR